MQIKCMVSYLRSIQVYCRCTILVKSKALNMMPDINEDG